jgi:pimeloyl-ACP methyl ester carboxylesterase
MRNRKLVRSAIPGRSQDPDTYSACIEMPFDDYQTGCLELDEFSADPDNPSVLNYYPTLEKKKLRIRFWTFNDRRHQTAVLCPDGEWRWTQRTAFIINGLAGHPGHWRSTIEGAVTAWRKEPYESPDINFGGGNKCTDQSLKHAHLWVAWDYRGFYGSDQGLAPIDISIAQKSDDAWELVKAVSKSPSQMPIFRIVGFGDFDEPLYEEIPFEENYETDDGPYSIIEQSDGSSVYYGYQFKREDGTFGYTAEGGEISSLDELKNHLYLGYDWPVSGPPKSQTLTTFNWGGPENNPQPVSYTYTDPTRNNTVYTEKPLRLEESLPRFRNNGSILSDRFGEELPWFLPPLFSWSTGVQVALQFLVEHQEWVRSCICWNGSPGNTMDGFGQPFFKVPGVGFLVEKLLQTLIQNRNVRNSLVDLIFNRDHISVDFFWAMAEAVSAGLTYNADFSDSLRCFASDAVSKSPGWELDYVREDGNVVEIAVEPILDNEGNQIEEHQTAISFGSIGIALQDHSVANSLAYVDVPTLIISGNLDVVVPSWQAQNIQEGFADNVRVVRRHYLTGTHFMLFQYPEEMLPDIWKFIQGEVVENKTEIGLLSMGYKSTLSQKWGMAKNIFKETFWNRRFGDDTTDPGET